MTLLDNKTHGRVIDALRTSLEGATNLSILSGEFSVFAFEALADALRPLERVRLLLTPGLLSHEVPPPAARLMGGEADSGISVSDTPHGVSPSNSALHGVRQGRMTGRAGGRSGASGNGIPKSEFGNERTGR